MSDDPVTWLDVAVYIAAGLLVDCALAAAGFRVYRVWRRRLGRATPPRVTA